MTLALLIRLPSSTAQVHKAELPGRCTCFPFDDESCSARSCWPAVMGSHLRRPPMELRTSTDSHGNSLGVPFCRAAIYALASGECIGSASGQPKLETLALQTLGVLCRQTTISLAKVASSRRVRKPQGRAVSVKVAPVIQKYFPSISKR